MLNTEKMLQQVKNYQLEILENSKEIFLNKPSGDVKLTVKRAIEWVNVGIKDLDCRSKEEMLELFNSWL